MTTASSFESHRDRTAARETCIQLNTRECCFICLKDVSKSPERDKPERGSPTPSLSALLRHLHINVKEEFPPAAFLSGGERTDNFFPKRVNVGAELCGDCSKVSQKVYELIQVIEVAQLEMGYYLDSVRKTMREARRTPSRMIRYHHRMNRDTSTRSSIMRLASLQRKLMDKCSTIADISQPEVLLARLDVSLYLKPPAHEQSCSSESECSDEPITPLENARTCLKQEFSCNSKDAETEDISSSFLDYSPVAPNLIETEDGRSIDNSSSSLSEASTSEKMEEDSDTTFPNLSLPQSLEKKELSCSFCLKTFISKRIFTRHSCKSENKPKRKPTRLKTSRSRIEYNDDHTSLQEIPCNTDRKSNSNDCGGGATMTQPEKRIRRHKCTLCSEIFHSKPEVKHHKNSVHFGSFTCDFPGCSKEYTRQSIFQLHQKICHGKVFGIQKMAKSAENGIRMEPLQNITIVTQDIETEVYFSPSPLTTFQRDPLEDNSEILERIEIS